ncbi:MAG: NAD(P)H-dependent oxidoreductase [Oscillospiraceae bacterium]|nr:NAD(P)H-dependent oxidoreductase [Oscillospiraceae bacterium]
MKKILLVDCCIRGEESRTRVLMQAFTEALDKEAFALSRVCPMEENMQPLYGDFFFQRQQLLQRGDLTHPRFSYARQFAQADAVVIAAPFWDLSFPAILKIYIENISVDGITFGYNENGGYGKCRGTDLIFLTTRGGFYEGTSMEQGARYLAALKDFFGFDRFRCIAAEGMDADGADASAALEKACRQAKQLARSLPHNAKTQR